MYKISKAINEICKKQEINYVSPHTPKLKAYKQDIDKLVEIYLKLKVIIGELQELKEKYPDLEFDVDLFDLDKTDHHIKEEAWKIMKRNKRIRC